MLPASLAFAWTYWRHYHAGILLILGYFLCAGAASVVFPHHASQDAAKLVFAGIVISTYSVFIFLLCVFAHGLEPADVLGRESCFPALQFRLPVSTISLVCWPMAYGAAVVMLLWFLSASFIFAPWVPLLDATVTMPLWWPAFFAASALAWFQAIFWSPFGLRWLRVILLATLSPATFALAVSSAKSNLSEGFLASAFACLTAAGWTVSYLGVNRARCGNGPNWEKLLRPFQRLAGWLPRGRLFASAAHAQLWFEWKLSGNSLPFMTGLTVLFALWPLFFGKNDVIPTEHTLLATLGVPIFLAGVFGQQGGGNNPGLKSRVGLGVFSATLPMTTKGMVAAMLKVAALSTLAAWTVAVVLITTAVVLTGRQEEVVDWWRQAAQQQDSIKIVGTIVTAGLILAVWTWKRQVDRLYFGLTGRPWVARCIALICFPTWLLIFLLAGWLYKRPELLATVFAALPWVLTPLILCKFLLAGWALCEGARRGLLDRQTAAVWVVSWLALVLLLFALLAWVVPAMLVAWYDLLLGLLFILPTARLAATPLALAWNRHR